MATDADLQAAVEHVCYEYRMLQFAVTVMESLQQRDKTAELDVALLQNMVIEVFALHTRTLVDFLWSEGGGGGDVTASQFSDGYAPGCRPQMLSEAKRKANKQLAHLTWARVNEYSGDAKPWDWRSVFGALERGMKDFLGSLSPDRRKWFAPWGL